MSKHRITLEVLHSGQPRAYADSEHVVRVTFEHTDWKDPHGPFKKHYMDEETAREYLSIPGSGYVKTTRKDQKDWFATYLDYVRPVDAKPASEVLVQGNPKQMVASIWEFRTITPYTD